MEANGRENGDRVIREGDNIAGVQPHSKATGWSWLWAVDGPSPHSAG